MKVTDVTTTVKGNKTVDVRFAKVREDGIIPSKREEDSCYDIYASMGDSFVYVIKPHETIKIPTGIASVVPIGYGFDLEERGSTGTIGMAQRCGKIDSGYRGEWLCPITNTTNSTMYIIKKPKEIIDLVSLDGDGGQAYIYDGNIALHVPVDVIVYPAEKAICQAQLIEVPQATITEITYEELKEIPSERGDGKLGSSGK